MTITYTPNRSYPKPDFDTRTWHDQMHTSLDMIDVDIASFTVNYTPADVLAKIKTVDGAGSGLDADLLDGQDSTYYAPVASPALTGTPTAPTVVPGTNSSTKIATTAFVQSAIGASGAAAPGGSNPLMDGVAAPGVSPLYSRQDHVHPIDTSRASLASPVFTGDPQAPTPAVGDNDTSIATTAFVTAALAAQLITSGVYTPVLTNGANVAASTAYPVAWLRVGDRVFVAMRLDLDPTAINTTTGLEFTLPVATTIGGTGDFSGACVGGTFNVAYHVTGAPSLTKGAITGYPPGVANHAVTGIIMYRVMP